ncbi:MAG TPA: PEPxxWA-CTERM sorting domain-containing protein [Sphingobium sp.]
MRRISKPLCLLALSVSGLALAAPAQAGLTLRQGAFITPTHFNGFEAAGVHEAPGSLIYGPYTEGGITVERIGDTGAATVFQAEGNYSWYTGSVNLQGQLAPGYTSIRAADFGAMSEIQFDATTEILTDYDNYPFDYQVLYQGAVIGTGRVWGLCSAYTQCFKTFGFSGALFDEVRLQSSILTSEFDPQGFGTDVMVLDNIYIREVPEPASWALMIAGFCAVGIAVRRRPHVRVAFA